MRCATTAAIAFLLLTRLAAAQSAPTVNATAASSTIGQLPHDIVRDVGALPSTDSTWWAAGAVASTLAARPFDQEATAQLNEAQQGAWRRIFAPGAFIGETAVQGGISAVTYGIGRLGRQPRTESAAVELLRAQLLTEGIAEALKFTVRRERPDGSDRHSFPSGHAAMMFATATVLERRFGWASVPVYMVASYVAASRVTTDRHYLSDVVAGAFLGTIVARTVTRNVASSSPASVSTGRFAFVWSIPIRSE